MELEDKLIELREKISKQIEEMDKEKEEIKSHRIRKEELESIKGEMALSTRDFMIPSVVDDRFRYFCLEQGLSADIYTDFSEYCVLTKIEYGNELAPYEIAYTVSKGIVDSLIDGLLKKIKNDRIVLSKIGDKLKKVQSTITGNPTFKDLAFVEQLFKEMELDLVGVTDEEKDELLTKCESVISSKIKRNEKEKELEEKEKRQALEEEQIEVIPEIPETPKVDPIEEFKSKLVRFERIKAKFDEYSDLFPSELYTSEIEPLYDLSDLTQLVSLEYPLFTELDYLEALISLFAMNNNYNDPYHVERVNDLLEKFSKKYELFTRIKELDDLKMETWSSPQLTEEDTEELVKYDAALRNIIGNSKYLTDELDETLANMKEKVHDIKKKSEITSIMDENGNIPIKSFILFDYEIDNDTNEKKPYITTDLDPDSTRTLIDKSMKSCKIVSNGYDDFCDLVDDLLLHSTPRILLNSNFARTDRIIRPIFYSDNSYEVLNTSMDNSSGMVRVKPTLTSYARFVDERERLEYGTPKYNQIKALIESKFPNVKLKENEPFDLYINYLDTFKASAKENYKPAFKRQKNSKIRDMVMTDNEMYTDEELEYISSMIDFSMKIYKDLEKMNPNFDFATIKTIKSRTYK